MLVWYSCVPIVLASLLVLWQKFIADVIAIFMLQCQLGCQNCWNEALVCMQGGSDNLFPWRGNNWRALPCKINNRMPPQERNPHLPLLEGGRGQSTSSIDDCTAILLSHLLPNHTPHEYTASGVRRIKSRL